ncbi:MAG TPA: G-protein coupled receptor [Clostridia bacterium]|nr:G-protein coupled receptor [Clostridia bacterium]
MCKRSKFLTLILACIPGVGHLYLGLMTRGLSFLVAFFGWITFVAFLSIASGQEGFAVLLLVLPILWFYSFFDALHLRRRLAEGEEVLDVSPITELTQGTEPGRKSKVWALVFSFVPGAGHMYLGYKEQGLQLMAIFFLSLLTMDWLRMTFIIFLIPIIWFYSMFDALQKVSQPTVSVQEDFFLVNWLRKNQRLVAYLLILMGAFLILNRVVFGYISWQYNQYIQTAVVSLLLIGGGIKLLRGSKVRENQQEVLPSREFGENSKTTTPEESAASLEDTPTESVNDGDIKPMDFGEEREKDEGVEDYEEMKFEQSAASEAEIDSEDAESEGGEDNAEK